MPKPRHHLPASRRIALQTGQHTDLDFTPFRLALVVLRVRAKWDHHTICTQGQGGSLEVLLQGLLLRLLAALQRLELALEDRHRPSPSRLRPTPHRPGTDGTGAIPPEQPGRG